MLDKAVPEKLRGKQYFHLLRDLIVKDYMLSFFWRQNLTNGDIAEGKVSDILTYVWDNGLNFKEECEKMGGAEFLSQKYIGEIVGANPLQESLDVLDKAFLFAQAYEAREILNDPSNIVKGVICLTEDTQCSNPRKLPRKLENLGFIKEMNSLSFCPEEQSGKLPVFHACLNSALKYAKKHNHLLVSLCDRETTIVLPKQIMYRVKFYDINERRIDYALSSSLHRFL